PAAPLGRAGPVDSRRQVIDCGRERGIVDFQPRQHRVADTAEPQHSLVRRQMVEIAVGPAREKMTLHGAHEQAGAIELHRHVVPGAGRPIEEDAGTRSDHGRYSPPTSSASAKPSPKAELGTPAAFTLSSALRPDNAAVSKLSRHSLSFTVT